MNLFLATLLVFIINLPFGYWRAHLKKMTLKWFLPVHLPIPLVIAIRYFFEIGFELRSYPAFIFAYFTGQFIGGYIKRKIKK